MGFPLEETDDLDYTLPQCSPEFLRVLKNIFDIRAMLNNPNISLEYLKGIQIVLDTIESNNNNNNNSEE